MSIWRVLAHSAEHFGHTIYSSAMQKQAEQQAHDAEMAGDEDGAEEARGWAQFHGNNYKSRTGAWGILQFIRGLWGI